MSAEEDYQKEEFIKLALNELQRDAGPLPEIDADEEQHGYKGAAMFEKQMQQQLQKKTVGYSSGTVFDAEKNSSFVNFVESDESGNRFFSSMETNNGYGYYKMADAYDTVQGLKDDVKQRSIRSVFSGKGNEKCSILGQIQTEQQKKPQSSKHQFKQQKSQFLKNKSSQFIKNTTKQVASAPGKIIKSYVKQAKIAQMLTSGDVDALVRTGVSFGVSGISRTLRMFGRGISRVCKFMLKTIFKILAPIMPYVIVIVASMFLLFLFIMGYEVDNTTNNTALYSYALNETQQTSGTESGTSGDGSSAPSGVVNTHMSSYIYFNQGDYSDPMGCTFRGVTTIRSSGCGLTALASVLATWTGDTSITPRTVLNYGLHGRDGNTCSIVLVSSSLYGGMCEKYGLTYETIVPKDAAKLRLALIEGKSVIVLLSNRAKWSDGNYVTSRTHYIVLMGFAKNGKIACMNPAGGNKKYIDFDTVVNDTGTDTFHVIYSEEKLQQWKQEDNK